MSYYINGGGECHIPPGNIVGAVAALTGWSEDDVTADGFGDDSQTQTPAQALVQLLDAQGFTELRGTYEENDGNVVFGVYEGNVGATEEFLTTLAPFVQAGGWLEFHGEDDSHWRWAFDGAQMLTEQATTVWASERALVRTFAADAARMLADEDGIYHSTDDCLEALRTALDQALHALGLPSMTELEPKES